MADVILKTYLVFSGNPVNQKLFGCVCAKSRPDALELIRGEVERLGYSDIFVSDSLFRVYFKCMIAHHEKLDLMHEWDINPIPPNGVMVGYYEVTAYLSVIPDRHLLITFQN